MKTIILMLCMAFTMPMINAQTSSNSKVTVNYSSDDTGGKGYKVNISISNTDDTYTLKASFPSHKTDEVKKFLNNHLEAKMSKVYGSYAWNYNSKGEEGYKVKLRKGKLSVYLDKEALSIDLLEDLIDAFSDLRDLIKDK
ncbi:hypothetical protein SAMN04487910_0233 [Aquimarina amphilecti]|uniref:Sensory transduction regulator n=1 Tax=Aquimarina amphilecti TaxID=1038014 RepID=A0A1H7G0E1_AQUAM|nr:hypothetical protein [Aquimarina amphilecti]SEK31598.1 hypothetical protein SAMN04487910_0233 [Aquimarina amphilecti]